MKKFKQVVEEVGQHNYGRYPHDTSAAGYTPTVVKKINAIIGRYIQEDTHDPQGVLYRIRGSLANIGLTFDAINEDSMVEKSGSMSYPLTAFGGRFGKDVDSPHDEFLNDDGISHKVEGGLALHISYDTTDTNQCRIRAHIE